tara:strand:- start:1295 stop:2353 length:1059 start_codon:yes stop_codon:yes gene_type:complete
MQNKIWFMEGLSSQREIVQAITSQHSEVITVLASHRMQRNEILSLADLSIIEPFQEDERLVFISKTVERFSIDSIHVGRNCRWFELHRGEIEACGASLTTGATSLHSFDVADNKIEFAEKMKKVGLPVVPSISINSATDLRTELSSHPFEASHLCIKPATGIYGLGFWVFDESASSLASFNNPDNRRVHPDIYLNALEQADSFVPSVLMPYLPGPEFSVDILAENGKVLAAVARCKNGLVQELSQSGVDFDLACSCAEAIGADGLVNVQTRKDQNGQSVLLEINLRPSGGIGYILHSGVNLPYLFTLRKLGLITQKEAIKTAQRDFKKVTVRPLAQSILYTDQLMNSVEADS